MNEHLNPAQARELADELRTYRELEGISGNVLAERLGWSATKVSRIENGLVGISEVDVVRFAAHCGVPADGLDALLQMCREPGAPGYWLSKGSSTLVFHENIAAASSTYDPLVVPGLLQTQEYATALIPDRPWLVNMRMERQRLLRVRPFEFFVHEQALRLPVGGNRVMNEQLLKLVLVAVQPMITIRVIPAALGARAMLGGEFMLFRFHEHQPLVYLDHGPLGLFLEHEDHVARYRDRLAVISTLALGRGESRELLAALASEFDRPEDSPDAPDNLAEEQLQFDT